MAKLTMDDALAMEEKERKRRQQTQRVNYPIILHEDWAEDHSDFAGMSESEFLGYQPGDQ